MKTVNSILTFLFGGIMILAGFMHFIKPHAYDNFIPDLMPKVLVNYVTGIIEILIGVGTITKNISQAGYTCALSINDCVFTVTHD